LIEPSRAPVCPNGASIYPAKGNALEIVNTKSRSFGPTAQPLICEENGWPVGPKNRALLPSCYQGCALRWINGWAFGPLIGL
jgi:hypothetical protein